MAQLDLKNCKVFIRDGYAGPGGAPLVNNGAGYAAAATVMTVDGFIGAVAIGDLFIVAGDPTLQHKITAHTETSLNTTSITFTPALAHAVVDNAIITMLPHQLNIRIGDGNCSWTEKRPVTYVKDRGILDTVRLGDQDPVEVKLDFTWVFLASASGDAAPTIEETMKKTGLASTWTTSSDDVCEPYCIDIEIEYTPPCSVAPELYQLKDFRYEDLGHDLKAGQVSVTGKCNITQISVTRPATAFPLVAS